MNYTTKILENKQVELEITLSKQEWDDALLHSYNKNKGKYAIEGFRKGKAPRKVIEKLYGEAVFFDDALNDSFTKSYQEILEKDSTIEPVDAPSIDIKSMDDNGTVIIATVTVKPEVELGKYKGLKISVQPKEISEKDVEEALKKEQEKHSRLVEVEGAIASGHTANINFSGTLDGKKFDGGTADNFDLEIGSKSFIDTFEDQLIGLKPEDEKDVVVTFPKDYQEQSLAGQKAVFAVKINSVKEKQLPELNDQFASDTTEFETLAALRESMKTNLQKTADDEAKRDLENKIVEAIVEETKVDIPSIMVEDELDAMFKDLEYRLMYQGLNLEGYAKYLNTTVDKLKEQRKDDAVKSVKVRLAMQKIVELEKLSVTEKDLDEKLETHAKLVNKSLDDYKASLNENRINHMLNEILTNKLLTLLIENNK